MLGRLATLAPLALLVACGPKPAPIGGGGAGIGAGAGTGTSTPLDAAVVERPKNDAPPTAGTSADVLARVFELGAEPSIPPAFGGLRPGMRRGDARAARPAAWGEAWEHVPGDEPGVTLHAGEPDGSDDPIRHLLVVVDQWDARARLAEAWGKPDVTAYNAATVCWLAPATRLKACQLEHLDQQAVELGSYEPLAEALAEGSPRAIDAVAPLLGATRADVIRAFPRHVEIQDPDDPSQHRIEVAFPATEYLAEVHPDRVVFWIDREGKVGHVFVRFGANDPALRPRLVEELRAAVDRARAAMPSAPSITVLESEPIDVVVVIDRDEDLQ